MSRYQQLDIIADAYVPALALTFLLMLLVACITKRYSLAQRASLILLVAATLSYGLMFIDGQWQLWPALGLDYSTHTAVSLALVLCLIHVNRQKRYFWAGSFIGYALLMLYQRYHSLADILSTALVIGPSLWWSIARIHQWNVEQANPTTSE